MKFTSFFLMEYHNISTNVPLCQDLRRNSRADPAHPLRSGYRIMTRHGISRHFPCGFSDAGGI